MFSCEEELGVNEYRSTPTTGPAHSQETPIPSEAQNQCINSYFEVGFSVTRAAEPIY